jgi:hypothetical protein
MSQPKIFDLIFPVRAESRSNSFAIWLDRAVCFFVLLTAFVLPFSIAATNAAWISGIFLMAVRFFVRPRPRFWRMPVDLPILTFWLWCGATCIFSYAPDLSFDRWRVLTLFPIAYLTAQNLQSLKSIKVVVRTLIAAMMITVVWNFAERFVGRGVQIYGVRADSPLTKVGLFDGDTLLKINGKKFSRPEDLAAALEENETVKLTMYRPDFYYDVTPRRADLLPGATAEEKLGFATWRRARNWRSAGFYDHYVTYAEVLQLVMSLGFGIFIALLKNKKDLFLASSLPLLACLALMSVAMLLTATRASQIGFVLSALTILALGANRKLFLAALALVVPITVGAAIYLQQSRNTSFVDKSDDSTAWRLTVWREGFNLLTESPRHLTVGVGIDSINRFRCQWGLFDNCRLPPGHFHSTPLQLAVESGLPAVFLWFWVVFRYGKSLLNTLRQIENLFAKGVLLGAFGGLVGFLASGFVHYNLGTSLVAMTFFLIMGLAFAVVKVNSVNVCEQSSAQADIR